MGVECNCKKLEEKVQKAVEKQFLLHFNGDEARCKELMERILQDKKEFEEKAGFTLKGRPDGVDANQSQNQGSVQVAAQVIQCRSQQHGCGSAIGRSESIVQSGAAKRDFRVP